MTAFSCDARYFTNFGVAPAARTWAAAAWSVTVTVSREDEWS
ncbi:hypothetical protein [Streptomyces sp. AA4]